MIPDDDLLRLAKDSGLLAASAIDELVARQRGLSTEGVAVALFDLARSTGVLGPDEAAALIALHTQGAQAPAPAPEPVGPAPTDDAPSVADAEASSPSSSSTPPADATTEVTPAPESASPPLGAPAPALAPSEVVLEVVLEPVLEAGSGAPTQPVAAPPSPPSPPPPSPTSLPPSMPSSSAPVASPARTEPAPAPPQQAPAAISAASTPAPGPTPAPVAVPATPVTPAAAAPTAPSAPSAPSAPRRPAAAPPRRPAPPTHAGGRGAPAGRGSARGAEARRGAGRKAGARSPWLIVGAIGGAAALTIVAVIAARPDSVSADADVAQAPPATSVTTEAPRSSGTERPADPARFLKVADEEELRARDLVERGRGHDALGRIDRLLKNWEREPDAADAIDQLGSLRAWVAQSVAAAAEAAKAPSPEAAPSPAAPRRSGPADASAPRPAPRRDGPTVGGEDHDDDGGDGWRRDRGHDAEEDGEDDGVAPPAAPAPPPVAEPRRPEGPAASPGGGEPAAAEGMAAGGRATALDPEYSKRRARVSDDDADGFQRLARWAEREDLFEEEKDALTLALRADPEHKRARARMDEVLAAEARHRRYETPWRREASILFVETNTTQAWLHYYCDSVAAFYNRFSKVFRVAQDPVKKWGRKIGVKIFASRQDFDRYQRESRGQAGESTVGFYSLANKELVLYHDPADLDETLNTLFHEGTHLFCHLALDERFHALPIWVSEGIAEYFGTARFERATKDLEFGRISAMRLADARECLDRQPVSLRGDLLTYDDYGSFGAARYALAWSLVHMLIEKRRPGSDKPIYRDRFVRYFDAVAGGADSLVAFEEHVGPARAIEEEWKAYVRELPLPPLEEGIARLGEDQHDEAIRLFEQHRREHPDDPKGAYWHGEALMSAGRLADAVGAYQAAVALEPQHADALSSLAWALMYLERHDESVDAARRTVAIRPSGVNQYLLAMAAVRARQKQVALTAVREAMKLLGPLPQLRELEALARAL